MVRRRRRARQILVRHPAGRHLLRAAGGAGQAALAHRAGLPGPQAGGGPGSLRRPKLARLPPPRQPLDRRLRIPDLRAGDDSPLRTSFLRERRAGCPTRRLSTPRRRRSDPNGTSPTLSPPCAGVSSWLSSDDCRDVHAAGPRAANTNANDRYDAVRLGRFPRNRYKPPLPADFAVDSLERTRRGTSEMSDKVTSEAERRRRLLKALSRCRAPIPGGGILARALHRTRRRALLARLDAEWRSGFVLHETGDLVFVPSPLDARGRHRLLHPPRAHPAALSHLAAGAVAFDIGASL